MSYHIIWILNKEKNLRFQLYLPIIYSKVNNVQYFANQILIIYHIRIISSLRKFLSFIYKISLEVSEKSIKDNNKRKEKIES